MNRQPEYGAPIPENLKSFVEQITSKLSNVPKLEATLQRRDGAYHLATYLEKQVDPVQLATNEDTRDGWWLVGRYYMLQGRVHEALPVFDAFYHRLLHYQHQSGKHVHKGVPLVGISDCYSQLQYPVHAKRYLMLTLCEDPIRDKGRVNFNAGPYARLVWSGGLTHVQVKQYMSTIWNLHKKHQKDSTFPEWVLQELDQAWMMEYPSTQECGAYAISTQYVSRLLGRLGTKSGEPLERLAHYLVASVPGFRARKNVRTPSTQYDIVASVEGHFPDFRSDIGRYIVCECKDWKKPADFTVLAKFSRVLQSTKSRCGIIFSKHGITGEAKAVNAGRELLKVYQGQGIIILVLSKSDLQEVAEGRNFLSMLRSKFEAVSLDLQP